MVDDDDVTGSVAAGRKLSRASKAELKAFLDDLSKYLGRASLAVVESHARDALLAAQRHYKRQRGPFVGYARVVLRNVRENFYSWHSLADLRAEHDDQVARDAAAEGGPALVAYYHHIEKLIRKAMRAAPKLWHVAGLSPDEVLHEVFVGVLAAMKKQPTSWAYSAEKVGKAATQIYAMRLRKRLYRESRRERSRIVEALPELVADGGPNQLETLILREEDQRQPQLELLAKASERLTRIQRSWLQAFARDVRENGHLNLSRVADYYSEKGKNRSSASRALAAIRAAVREARDAANDDAERPVVSRASAGR